MCGRYSLAARPDDLQVGFGFDEIPADYRPRFNIAPTQDVWVAVLGEGSGPRLEPRRWGLVPFWAKEPSIGNRLINARAETVAQKPAFRDAFRKRRCWVVADGFYEWMKREGGKAPMRVRFRSGEPFALAGLWESWDRGRDGVLRSCTILTTAANDLMRPIHDRMPVLLDRGERDRWLDPEATPKQLAELLGPYRGADLEAYEVSTLVNSPKNDMPECFEPVAPAQE